MKPFVILAQARSGSTLLRRALHEHPDVVCHGEVLSPAWIAGLVPPDAPEREGSPTADVEAAMADRTADLENFLDTRIFAEAFAPAHRAAGFKIVYMDLLGRPQTPQLQAYFADRGVTVIHLCRLNPLAAYVSAQRMEAFGLNHAADGDDTPPEAPKLRVVPEELTKFTAWQTLFRNQIDLQFNVSLRLHYEHMAAQWPSLLQTLGVPDRPFASLLKKLTPTDLRQAVENYDEVAWFDLGR